MMASAEVLLDRRGEPGRRDVEPDRPALQAPPHRERSDRDKRKRRAGNISRLAQTQPPMPCAQAGKPCVAPTRARGRSALRWFAGTGGLRVLMQGRLEARLQLAQRRQIRIRASTRHAPPWRSPRLSTPGALSAASRACALAAVSPETDRPDPTLPLMF